MPFCYDRLFFSPKGEVVRLPTAVAIAVILVNSVLVALSAPASATSLGMLGVTVDNKSEPVLCAEKDNVSLTFASPQVKQFRIEAAHPAYVGTLREESSDPDWTACDFTGEAVNVNPPRRTTIYEHIEMWIVAHRNDTFWRPATAKVRIGDTVHEGVHMLQVWVISHMGGEEVLVLYPQDGYWRIRPKAPKGRQPTTYGSSVLIGPVSEDKGRLVVDIDEVAFDPATRSFKLTFKAGGSATIDLSKLDIERNRLDVTFDKPIAGKPFAAMRSMYVTRLNNDVADIAVLAKGAKAWREEPIMAFTGATDATDIWAGRTTISRHNTSSPDMIFGAFSDGTMKPKEWKEPRPDAALPQGPYASTPGSPASPGPASPAQK